MHLTGRHQHVYYHLPPPPIPTPDGWKFNGPRCLSACLDLRLTDSPGDSTAVLPARGSPLLGSVSLAGIGVGCLVQTLTPCAPRSNTHVPRTSLKSNIFLMSSTCFFHEPSTDSPFSFAISHRGLAGRTRKPGTGEEGREGGEQMTRCRRTSALSPEPLRRTPKQNYCSCVFRRQLPGSFAGLRCLFCPRRQTGAPDDRFVLARGGYLTNPLDDTELPHCKGEPHRLFLAPSSFFTCPSFLYLFFFFVYLPAGIFLSTSSGSSQTPGSGYPASGRGDWARGIVSAVHPSC